MRITTLYNGGLKMKEFWEQVYESMACHVVETAKIPGVEDAFADRAY